MWLIPLSGPGTVLEERYRLEERLSGPDPLRGSLWRAVDVMAGDLPVAIREIQNPAIQERFKGVWPQLQSLLHPQLPRSGELLELDGVLWLVRDWQDGVASDVLLRQRSFGAGEVLQLLQLSGVLYCNAELSDPWGIEIPELPGVMNVEVVTRGHCWIELEGQTPVFLPEGSLVMIPRGNRHKLRSKPGDETTWLEDIPIERVGDRFENMCFVERTRGVLGVLE